MFKQGIAKDFSIGIEAHKHFQVTSKTTRGTLHGSTEVFLLGILCLIENKSKFLATHILTDGISHRDSNVINSHHTLDSIGKSLFFLLGDRSFSQVVHVRENPSHDDGHSSEYQHHIQ